MGLETGSCSYSKRDGIFEGARKSNVLWPEPWHVRECNSPSDESCGCAQLTICDGYDDVHAAGNAVSCAARWFHHRFIYHAAEEKLRCVRDYACQRKSLRLF